MKTFSQVLLVTVVTALLCGCAQSPREPSLIPQETELVTVSTEPEIQTVMVTEPESISVEQEAQALAEQPPAAPVVLAAEAAGERVECCDSAEIDHSRAEQGYVMVRYTAETDKRLKVLVRGPQTTYQYDLPQGEWTVLPLSDGDGSYEVSVYENITGSQYALVLTLHRTVELEDSFAPFLRPNQYVNYTESTRAVAKGMALTEGLEDPLQKVEAVYDFVVATMDYDYEKAATVKSGYLPDLDAVLDARKGICFDYAALMTAMLRSQEIPCKMVIGYAGQTYHAWISVWTEESGWVNGAIFFDGKQWKRMDPTFASTAESSDEILNFIQNGNYRVKYLY